MSSIAEGVAAVFKKESEHKGQLSGLMRLLSTCLQEASASDMKNLMTLTESVVNLESGSMVVSKQFVSNAIDSIEKRALPVDVELAIDQNILGIISARCISYEEQIIVLRMRIASILEANQRYYDAAQMLAGIPVETGQRQMTSAQKMDLYLRIADLLLSAQRPNEADLFVNRAHLQNNEVPPELFVKHKATSARVLDGKRKFIEAAQRYYELSQNVILGRSDKDDALNRAITCTVLASPGTPRTKMLSLLYKDDRVRALPRFGLLQKLFFDRLVKPSELEELERGLETHQILDESGESIIRSVILEHNMTAISHLYNNISIEMLASLLGIDRSKAEEVAVQMISSDRLNGTIDQIEGYIDFIGAQPLPKWDEQIQTLCQQVNRIYDLIAAHHPELQPTH